ncbi:MAG: DNA-binding transcriptional regulator Fis [Pseudohongiellaceae bacterium]
MNKPEGTALSESFEAPDTGEIVSTTSKTLRSEVEKALDRYFEQIGDESVSDLHQLVMAEVEEPLLQAVMRFTGNNQSKASIMLGLNRGTLRTKLKHYGML